MGFSDGKIILDSPTNAYYAGQRIHAKFDFQVRKDKTIYGIIVLCKGECKVEWETKEFFCIPCIFVTIKVERTYRHLGKETYFNLNSFLIGNGNDPCIIQAGSYSLPFSFDIPSGCPSSFEGTKGYIRYEIEIIKVGLFSKSNMKKIFKVAAPLDLNIISHCKDPMMFEFEDTYCCFCVMGGSSMVKIQLPASGFCPGQVVPVEISCATVGSMAGIKNIKFSFEKKVKYTSAINPAQKKRCFTIGESKTDSVKKNTTRNWVHRLTIPKSIEGNVDSCRFIDIEYKLRIASPTQPPDPIQDRWQWVAVIAKGCHFGSEDTKTITIGTVPVAGSVCQ